MLQSSSPKQKLVKPLQKIFFGPSLRKKGVIKSHAQNKKKIFSAETKADHQPSFIYQNIIIMF